MTNKTTYDRYSDDAKKRLGERANNYSKENYKRISLVLKPDIFAAFENLRERENLTRTGLIEKLLENYQHKS
ncbi:hypothetical protein [Gallibacterium sp. AGMB14963]|uniref:hypothetical protein n=1 Tax=Gallibacterium faecale TaxID=3019086 RepID=UPI0022F155ED|nr:hypothetical protein [Gallibacterium sp. AGMB14963]MDA3977686.1 hypothetical protein [Gallibacterium sp. AGMB14963]